MEQFIIRLTLDSNAVGPFNIYTGSTSTTPIKSNQTRDQIIAGVLIDLPGEPTGTQYTIFVENKQPGCEDQTISQRVTVFGNLDIITITGEFEPGSLIATYTANSRQILDADLRITWTNIFETFTGDSVTLTPSILILSGGTSGSTIISSEVNYDNLTREVLLSGLTESLTGLTQFDFRNDFVYVFADGPTPTPTSTPGVVTPTPTNTPTVTPTNTPTNSTTPTVTPTNTPTNTVTPTNTPTVTPTNTPTVTPTNTPTNTVTPTTTPTVTPTNTPTNTVTPTTTPTPTNTPTNTVTPSVTPSITPTNTITPTITPTNTPTSSITPTPTTTPTNTPTVTPTTTPTNTPTNTPTPTVTPSEAGLPPAYLLIEPSSIDTDIGAYMFSIPGSSWFGYTNGSGPTDIDDIQNYLDFFSLSAGTGGVPSIITQTIPQTGGGTDSEGNTIVQYNFLTTEVSAGTVSGNAYYSWLIPDDSIGGTGSGNRQTKIDYSNGSGPNTFTDETMDSVVYGYGTIVNPGGPFANGTYRLYSPNTIGGGLYFNNTSTTLYFKGSTVTS